MTTFGPRPVISEAVVMPDHRRYLAFSYNNKPRVGLDLCDDMRTNKNRVIYTLDGIRTMKKDVMLEVRDVTTLEVPACGIS